MKRIFTSALVLALSIGAAEAQSTSPDKAQAEKKEQKHGKHFGKMHGNHDDKGFKDVNLTEDQKARLQSIRENYKKESEALRSNTSLSAEERQAERKRIHEKFRTESASILTPDQKQQMQKMKAEKGEKGKARFDKGDRISKGQHDKMKAKGEEIKKDLNLSGEQEVKMKQIRETYKAKFEALKANKDMSPEQKRTEMKSLMQAQQEEMRSILTKEQQDKMQNLRKERSDKGAKK